MKLTQEHGFHAAGILTTAFAARSAVTYLQTITPDYATALGFSAAISAAVYYGWKFTLSSKTKKRGIPLLLASVIMTSVSGYTVYQSSAMPLQAAAIAAANAADIPRLAEYNAANTKQQQAADSLQTSVDDLRTQNTADQAAIATITGKGADWKKQQLRNAIEKRNTQITELQAKQAALTQPSWVATPPKPLEAAQTTPLLARAFAFELIMIMFMLFARFAKSDNEEQQSTLAAEIQRLKADTDAAVKMLSAALTTIRHDVETINNLAIQQITDTTAAKLAELAEATTTASNAANQCATEVQTITDTTATKLAELAEATTTASNAANQCATEVQAITDTTATKLAELAEATTTATKLAELAEATTTASNGILTASQEASSINQSLGTTAAEAAQTTASLLAAIDGATSLAAHLQTAFVPFAGSFAPFVHANANANEGTNGANAKDPYSVLLYQLKHRLIPPKITGKLPVDLLKEKSGLGRKLIEKAQLEATQSGWLIRNTDGSYSYPETTQAQNNVIQLRSM